MWADTLHSHYSQVHSGSKWEYLFGSNLMGWIKHLKKSYSIRTCAKHVWRNYYSSYVYVKVHWKRFPSLNSFLKHVCYQIDMMKPRDRFKKNLKFTFLKKELMMYYLVKKFSPNCDTLLLYINRYHRKGMLCVIFFVLSDEFIILRGGAIPNYVLELFK